MAEIKFTISTKTGKSYNKAIDTDSFNGKKIGEKVSGDDVGLPGYELQITGGSDTAGFPMRPDVLGHGRAKPLLTGGVGIHLKRKGMRKRKTVIGREINNTFAQINLKVVKEGSKSIEENFGIAPKEAETSQ